MTEDSEALQNPVSKMWLLLLPVSHMANVALREPLSQLYLLVHHEWLLVKPLNTMKKYSDLKDLQ